MLLDQWRSEIKCSLASKLFVVGLSISLTSSYIIDLPHTQVVTVNNNHHNFNLINNITNSSYPQYQHHNNNHHYNTINKTSNNFSHHNNISPSQINACGTRLKQEIKSICASQKNSQLVNQQQSSDQISNGNGLFERNPVVIEPSINEIKQRRGSSESNKLIRVPRGVIQECCHSPCHRSSLLKYCSNFESRRPMAVTLAPSIFDPASSSSVENDNDENGVRKQEPKAEQTIHSESSGILPLILSILWDWGESKEKRFSSNVMNYHPQKLVKLARTGNPRLKQHGTETNDNHYVGRTRSISTRNIDQNRWKIRQPPASDETRRDLTSEMSTSDFQDNDDFNNNIQKNTNNDSNNESNTSSIDNNNDNSEKEKSVPSETGTKPISLATTVTDELHHEVFAMSDYYG